MDDDKMAAVADAMEAYASERIKQAIDVTTREGIRVVYNALVAKSVAEFCGAGPDVSEAVDQFDRYKPAIDYMRRLWPWLDDKK
jgi:hypothetical protein